MTYAVGMDAQRKVLLVTNTLEAAPKGGRELLCKLNHDALAEIFGENLIVFELEKKPIQGLAGLLGAFHGYIDGLNLGSCGAVIDLIGRQGITDIFIDGSNLGALAAAVKAAQPQVSVVSFFHNVEVRFFLGSLRQRRTLRALAVLIVNYLAERRAVRCSDKRICLSERDSRQLDRIYGRSATHIAPMALADKMPAGFQEGATASPEPFALFVGGSFYANRAGITWFVKNVAPRTNVKTCIVGRGFEDLKDVLELEGRVEVIGAVDSLAQWYHDAHFVIAPIFDGSGMKTKVAEALMYGKKIIGTPEAFSGYEGLAERAGRVSANADEFVQAMEAADDMVKARFDPEMRALYEKTYSLPAARARLAEIMNAQAVPAK